MNTFQAITRTIIMLGTVVVGMMAWRVYGPPAEKLAPLIDRAVDMAHETLGRAPSEPAADVLLPPRLKRMDDSAALPLAGGAALRIDADVAPAGHTLETATSSTIPRLALEKTPPPVDDLLMQLESLGAVGAEMQPWGASGQVYHFQCRLPAPENPSIECHFDAIDSDPRIAVEQVLEAVRRRLNH